MNITVIFGSRSLNLSIPTPAEKIDPVKSVTETIKSFNTRYKQDLIRMMQDAINDEITRAKNKAVYEMEMKEKENKLKALTWFQRFLIKVGNIEVKQLKGPRK
jgi:hypothetical protein